MSAYVSTKSRMSVQTIAKISILGALAFLVMMFEIPQIGRASCRERVYVLV